MRRVAFDSLCLGALIAGGGGLILAATMQPGRFAAIGSWVALLGFLLTILVVVGSLRGTSPGNLGPIVLLTGLALLAASAALGLVSGAGGTASGWLTGGRLNPDGVPVLLRAVGALGIALGFVMWANPLIVRAVESERRDRVRRAVVAELEDKVRFQEIQLEEALTVDGVTGVLNRRTFLARLEEMIRRDARLQRPLGFLLIRLPGFRLLDAQRWRSEGDDVLKQVAAAVASATRGTDLLGRTAEDEFAAALGECADLRPVVDRLFLALQENPPAGESGVPARIRVGAVKVEDPADGVSVAALFETGGEAVGSLKGSAGMLCQHVTFTPGAARAATRA